MPQSIVLIRIVLKQQSSYWSNHATELAELSMESLLIMGNDSAVNEHIRKEKELSKPNLTSTCTNIFVKLNFVPTTANQINDQNPTSS